MMYMHEAGCSRREGAAPPRAAPRRATAEAEVTRLAKHYKYIPGHVAPPLQTVEYLYTVLYPDTVIYNPEQKHLKRISAPIPALLYKV